MKSYLTIISALLLSGCISNTRISYFPDQRGPFYCHLADSPGADARRDDSFEVVPVQNTHDAFALRKASTNEIVVLANKMKVLSATANPTYEKKWGQKNLAAMKLLVVAGVEGDPKIFAAVSAELHAKYPGAKISESIPTDIFVDIYSIWLGSEYTRSPCDGVAFASIPFEVTIPGEEGNRFLMADGAALQLAGRVLYRDARTGWRFHRSFTVQRSDFKVAE